MNIGTTPVHRFTTDCTRIAFGAALTAMGSVCETAASTDVQPVAVVEDATLQTAQRLLGAAPIAPAGAGTTQSTLRLGGRRGSAPARSPLNDGLNDVPMQCRSQPLSDWRDHCRLV